MKVQTKELKQAIKQVKNIVPKKTTISVLQHYLITAKGNKLTISATDLELYAEHTIICDDSDNFQFTIPASNFNLAEKFKQDETEITVNEKVIIRNGKREYKFAADDPDAFPQFPKVLRSLASFSLSAETIKDITEMYRFTSDDELRETLHNIYLNNDNGNLKAVATDGHRIIVKNIQKTEQDISFILRKSAQTVLKNIKQSAEFEIIETNGGEFAQVKAGNTTYLIRETDVGQYPNWKRVIPDDDNFKQFTLSNPVFQEYLRDCLELFRKYYKKSDYHKPEVFFDFKDKTLKLTYNDVENEINFSEEFDIETEIAGKRCYDAQYLLDFANMDSDKVNFKININDDHYYHLLFCSDNWETRMILGIKVGQ